MPASTHNHSFQQVICQAGPILKCHKLKFVLAVIEPREKHHRKDPPRNQGTVVSRSTQSHTAWLFRKSCKGKHTEWSNEKLLGEEITLKCFSLSDHLWYLKGPGSVSSNAESLHIAAVTALLVDNKWTRTTRTQSSSNSPRTRSQSSERSG